MTCTRDDAVAPRTLPLGCPRAGMGNGMRVSCTPSVAMRSIVPSALTGISWPAPGMGAYASTAPAPEAETVTASSSGWCQKMRTLLFASKCSPRTSISTPCSVSTASAVMFGAAAEPVAILVMATIAGTTSTASTAATATRGSLRRGVAAETGARSDRALRSNIVTGTVVGAVSAAEAVDSSVETRVMSLFLASIRACVVCLAVCSAIAARRLRGLSRLKTTIATSATTMVVKLRQLIHLHINPNSHSTPHRALGLAARRQQTARCAALCAADTPR